MSLPETVEKTVACTNCGHPVWFTADEHDPHPCTDCGTINARSQRDIWDGAEDEPTIGATDSPLLDTALQIIDLMREHVEALLPEGYVIARAADCITADQRAAIGRYVVFMDGDNTPYEDDIDLWESDKSIFRAIADGGAK